MADELNPTETQNSISAKDWLDLSWKYFQQHAQQRISYFNFFVIFSTILTTGLVSTYQKTFGLIYLGVPIGALQAFLAFMFWKLDQRNKFLTKHAEEIIKNIEKTDEVAKSKKVQLFLDEKIKFIRQKSNDKKKLCFQRMISHSTSYETIYLIFFCWGIGGGLLPFIIKPSIEDPAPQKIETHIDIKYSKLDSLELEIAKGDSLTALLLQKVNELTEHINTIELIYKESKRQ